MTKHNGWTKLIIPAVEDVDRTYRIGPRPGDLYHRRAGEVLLPDREPQHVLDEMRAAIGSMNYAAQYDQDPIPPGGNVIQREWLRFYDDEPEDFERLIASWDTASTIGPDSSYSVGLLWGQAGPDFYLLDLMRERLETPALRRLIVECDEAWSPHETHVEDTELGRSLVQDIRRTSAMRINLFSPIFSKEARLLAQSSRFEAGHVHLPSERSWLRAYVDELLAAPFGKYWDQVDATSQALHVLTARASRDRPRERPNPVRRNPARRNPERRNPERR